MTSLPSSRGSRAGIGSALQVKSHTAGLICRTEAPEDEQEIERLPDRSGPAVHAPGDQYARDESDSRRGDGEIELENRCADRKGADEGNHTRVEAENRFSGSKPMNTTPIKKADTPKPPAVPSVLSTSCSAKTRTRARPKRKRETEEYP